MYDNINKKHGLGRVTNPTNAPIPETPQGGGRKNTINRLNPSLANNVDYKYLTKDTFPVRPLNWNTRFYDYSNAANDPKKVIYPSFSNGWPYWYNTPINPDQDIALYDQQNEKDIEYDNIAYIDKRMLNDKHQYRLNQLKKLDYLKNINKQNLIVENFNYDNNNNDCLNFIIYFIVIAIILLLFKYT